MPLSDEEPPFSRSQADATPDIDLRGHDGEVLNFLTTEELTHFTFDGLQHSLRLHPETLTRSLSRLEEAGFIRKNPQGYITSRRLYGANLSIIQDSAQTIQLAQTLLPTNTTPSSLLDQLRGRWFGHLRWLGYSQRSDSLALKWVTIDGRIRLTAKLEGPLLTIHASLRENAKIDEAVQVSHQLLSQLAGMYSHLPRARLAAYTIAPPFAAAM